MRRKLRRLLALMGAGLAGLVAACALPQIRVSVDDLCPATEMPIFDRDGGFRCIPRPIPGPVSTPPPSPTPTPSATPSATPSPSPSPRPAPEPTPTPPTAPPAPPGPSPRCVPESAMPAEPVSVTAGGPGFVAVGSMRLAPSSCEAPGENSKCFRDRDNGSTVPWEEGESTCWSYPAIVAATEHWRSHGPVVKGGKAMRCELAPDGSEATDPDAQARGCSDAYGRRVKVEDGRWTEQFEGHNATRAWSGWWHGFCPPRAPKTCDPAPPPPTATPAPGQGATCSLPKLPECGDHESTGREKGQRVYGCCRESEIRDRFLGTLRAAQAELATTRPDLFLNVGGSEQGWIDVAREHEYTIALAALLTAKYGVCATSGGPGDEVGIKNENGWSEQYDVVRSDGYIVSFQTVTCRPARF